MRLVAAGGDGGGDGVWARVERFLMGVVGLSAALWAASAYVFGGSSTFFKILSILASIVSSRSGFSSGCCFPNSFCISLSFLLISLKWMIIHL